MICPVCKKPMKQGLFFSHIWRCETQDCRVSHRIKTQEAYMTSRKLAPRARKIAKYLQEGHRQIGRPLTWSAALKEAWRRLKIDPDYFR